MHENAKQLLLAADIFFDADDGTPPWTINLNDTFGWGCADCEVVPEEELPRLAELFQRYGRCGMLYWVAERRKLRVVEFADINRFIAFVAKEEELRKELPSSTKRSDRKVSYTIGVE